MFEELEKKLQEVIDQIVFFDDIDNYREVRNKLIKEEKGKINLNNIIAERETLKKALKAVIEKYDRTVYNMQFELHNPAKWVEIENSGTKLFAMQLSTGCLIQYGSTQPFYIKEADIFEANGKYYLEAPKMHIIDMANFMRNS